MAKGRSRASHADFIGISRRVANSPAFMALPAIARALYFDLRRQFNGYNNGVIAAVLEGTEDRPGLAAYGWPPRSVFKYIKVLLDHHLIEKTRQGGIGAMSKICSLYAFTDLPVVVSKEKGIPGSMASLAYLNFTPKEQVKRTRQKKPQAARGAYIAARGACTQVHAVPTDPPVTARGAAFDFRLNGTQAIDATTKTGDSDTEREKAPHMHAVHTLLSLPEEGAVPGGGGGGDLPVVDPALKGGKAGARPEKMAARKAAANPAMTICQHAGCDTLTVGSDFCRKHRPLASTHTAAQRLAPVERGEVQPC